MLCSAGKRGWDIAVHPQDLVRLTNAVTADIRAQAANRVSAMSLTGKTMFISGASRGIGLAIAKRAAADGANIALVAKTAEPHPKLPGTVYTAAKEIEDAGGQALPIVGDIRDGDSVARPRSPRPSNSSAASTSA